MRSTALALTLSSAFFMTFFMTFAVAGESETSCDDATTQANMNRCAGQAYQTADSDLNEAYQTLIEPLEGDARQALVTAQRAWIAFRDAECDYAAQGVAGGSAEPMVRNQCLTTLTRERTRTLDEHAHCEEGDLSCSR
ncbi:lysozyme inhibitor LprI family protein [Vreelandella malpeensis]|nr:lysozyme inhibitor LprI family protein [Halomonas malpeensis]